MRALERLICDYLWFACVGLLVSSPNARPEQRPTSASGSGDAGRRPETDRTVLPGW